MTELGSRRGVIYAMNKDSGVFEVCAEMPDGSMTDFDYWLSKTASNRGSIRHIERNSLERDA